VKQPRAQKRSNSLPVSLHPEVISASRMKFRTETTDGSQSGRGLVG
jgi:hypothetical protein